MKSNKILAVLVFIFGILAGIVSVIIFLKDFSAWRIWYSIFFMIACLILVFYGVQLYRAKGKLNFHRMIDQLGGDLFGLLSSS